MSRLAEFGRQINVIRLPIFMALLAIFLLAVPHQMHEVYRALAQQFATTDARLQAYWEIAQSLIGALALGCVFWLLARRSAAAYSNEVGPTNPERSTGASFLTWAPRAIALAPILATAYGVFQSRVLSDLDVERVRSLLQAVFFNQWKREGYADDLATRTAKANADPLIAFNDSLLYAGCGLVVIAMAALVLMIACDRQRLADFLLRTTVWRRRWLVVALALLTGLVVGAIVVYPVWLPQRIGVIALTCTFLILLNLVLWQLEIWGKALGISLATLIAIYALLLAASDFNDNHAVRTVKNDSVPLPARVNVKEALHRWYQSRQTRSRFEGRRFPIYVVAAQGGGVYAGMHTASFLAEVEDLCPGFAHHIFAISGVSGGSVGAAIFAALTKDFDWAKYDELDPGLRYGCVAQLEGERRTYFTDAVNAIFQHDLWSPLAAGLLFPDFAQWFLPIGIPQLDRARSLERALEEAYSKGVGESNFLGERSTGTNRLGELFIEHWDPTRFPHTPALALNATETHTGNRRVISPFAFSGSGLGFVPVWSEDGKRSGTPSGIRLPLSTAAIVSARFPWVTPAASFEERGRKVRLVDGGYFENSGTATAIDLIVSMLDGSDIADRIEINLIIFTSIGFSDPGRSYGFGELLEPVRALLGTRSARGNIEIEKAFSVLSYLPRNSKVTARVIKLNLEGYGYPLPLGWRLSDITRHIISYQSGALPEACPEQKDAGAERGVTAGCAKKLIHAQLK